jgi:hypothetical protein
MTDHSSYVVFPAFSLDRGDAVISTRTPTGSYFGPQGRMTANEGARSLVSESSKDRTPLGHDHREYIRLRCGDHSVRLQAVIVDQLT